ncbi:MAG TPA: DegT/DnrJ/EryC1/StrS family aminotransferase, partial [Syntrophales bacterium]|nr:DegT/DnrJ/EryC1/StrS family aminotransferase [Syntrophales bacterium]
VEPDTLNMDPRKVEACLSGKTKAIIPVHYAGHPVEMDGILDLARSRRLLVLEDAAHALPARYRGRLVGSGSNPASFSFYATKNLTTGEGGMLTADPSFLERARIVSLHGMSRDAWKRYDKAGGWFYEVVLPGFKYNMTDIQASLGLHQLKKLEAFQKRRRRLVEMYQEAFRGEEALEIPVEKAHVEHAWYLYVLRIVPETLTIHRDRFIEELKERNIGTSVHFIPIHFHPYYRDKYGYGKRDFPVARGNYERMMSLPLNLRMTDGDVADVVEAVLEVVRKFRR